MFRKYSAAGASIVAFAFAAAALSGSSCAINEIGLGPVGTGGGGHPSTCSDSVTNGDETDVNCGGTCGPCATGKACLKGADCESGVCASEVCAAATCDDLLANGTETDTDCGGSCGSTCADGKKCLKTTDCKSTFCAHDRCVAQCDSGAKDGDEADVDCGGSCAAKCANGKTCNLVSDCSSGFCVGAQCVAQCNNLVVDGDETDLDCGGTCATKCSVGRNCKAKEDCVSGVCSGSVCIPDSSSPICFNGTQDAPETDKDCGGGTCPGCKLGDSCLVDSDCIKTLKCTGAQTPKTCQLP